MIQYKDMEIYEDAIKINLKRLTNQIYKLLPNREEGLDWETPLTTILEEFSGMGNVLLEQQNLIFSLICKLEGLFKLTEKDDFILYRRTIFECLNLVSQIKESL